MSDPVTNADIEDVLSSIRRLVSDDGRTESDTQPDAAENAARPATRLVLTPALRVPDKDGAALQRAQADGDERGQADPDADGQMEHSAGMTGHLLLPDAASDELHFHGIHAKKSSDWSSGKKRPAGAGKKDGVDADAAAADASQKDSAGKAPAGAPWRDPGATLFGAASIAAPGIEAAPGEESGPAAETRPGKEAQHESEPVQDAETVLEAEALQQAEPVQDAEAPGAEPAASAKVSAVVQKIAELEAKVGQSQEQWEPDGKSNDPYSGTNVETLQWEDHTEEDDTPSSGSAGLDTDLGAEEIVAEAAADEALDALGEEESYLDEETLRELVAEIVREELQGALGERITRNVRKLVRREIHRALAAQDLL